MPTRQFTIKIDRKNGGSQKMWLGTEEIPPGGVIAKHKHLGQDEILLIQTGSAHVWLGPQERTFTRGLLFSFLLTPGSVLKTRAVKPSNSRSFFPILVTTNSCAAYRSPSATHLLRL
jgi:uncharacterized RmlC-like cupin family protein